MAGRLGGEESVLVMAATDQAGVAQLAEQDQGGHRRDQDRPQGRAVTVSVGVGVGSGEGADPDRLYRDVDEAVYVAKAAGRNGVATGSPGRGTACAREPSARLLVLPAGRRHPG